MATSEEESSDHKGSLAAPEERTVFVVHGRDEAARDAMFAFLYSIDLKPLEWSHALTLTASGAPYVGDVLQAAFGAAKAIVVLLTPDDLVSLREELRSPDDPDYEAVPTGQARPNVLFEAGMALGRNPDRTIIVEVGTLRPFSDIAGRHVIRFDGSIKRRHDLAMRLNSAGCIVDLTGTLWHTAGDFTSVIGPGPGSGAASTAVVDTGQTPSWLEEGTRTEPLVVALLPVAEGRFRITLANTGTIDLHDLTLAIPDDEPYYLFDAVLPLSTLAAGRSASYAVAALRPGDQIPQFRVTIRGRDADGVVLAKTLTPSLADSFPTDREQ